MGNIELTDITKKYGNIPVFENFSAVFKQGEISCVLGRSGSGKTTLLNIISGITFFEGKVNTANQDISYVFQDNRLINNLTVYQNVEYVLLSKIKDKRKRTNIITPLLEAAEIEDKKDKYPQQLSGGMKQRLSIARAFAYPSKTLLMDEPFRSLDPALKSRIINTFLKLWDKRTVVFVTHDIDEALLLSDTIYILNGSPATVTNMFDIEKPLTARDITDAYFSKIRKEIYRIMNG
jgi:NitT/TauT family transport system ATP-binding protein